MTQGSTHPTSQDKYDQESIKILAEAVTKAINDTEGEKRFVDIKRLPLICLAQAHQAKSIEELKMGIFKALNELKEMIASNRRDSDEQHQSFLTKESFRLEFDPIKTIVFGGVGIALVAMVGAIISIVLK